MESLDRSTRKSTSPRGRAPRTDEARLRRGLQAPKSVLGRDLRTLLVPVDFSPQSLEAFDFAVSLAQQVDASIVLLHVLDPIHAPGRFEAPRLRSVRAEALDKAKRRLAELARRRVKPHVAVTQRLLKGIVYSVIVGAAAQARADLIVMGSEGRTGMSRFLIGSVAEKVVRHARCSVLVVRGKGR